MTQERVPVPRCPCVVARMQASTRLLAAGPALALAAGEGGRPWGARCVETRRDFQCDVSCWDTRTRWFDRRSGLGCAATTAGARLQGGRSQGARARALHCRSPRSRSSAGCPDWSCPSTYRRRGRESASVAAALRSPHSLDATRTNGMSGRTRQPCRARASERIPGA